MTAEEIYEKNFGDKFKSYFIGQQEERWAIDAIQEALNINATHLAELEKENKENKELREGHNKDVRDAYWAGYDDGTKKEKGENPDYADSKDYYIKTFNNEKC